jgi:cytochrome c oxidase assembly protein subunit 15
MIWGAFTAGMRAGWLYNHFPMMDETHWLPPELDLYHPFVLAFVLEPSCVQFFHRCLALTTFVLVLNAARRSWAFHCPPRMARLFTALFLMAFVQVALGISTLLTHVNIIVASLHQAGALTLLTLLAWLLHELPFIPQEK